MSATFGNLGLVFPVDQFSGDDATKIQSALDAVDANNGGSILFQPRVYDIGSTAFELPTRIGGSGDDAPISVRLFCEARPATVLWGEPPVNTPGDGCGARIVTSRSSGSPIFNVAQASGSIFDNGVTEFSGTRYYFEGLTFFTGVDPAFAILDLRNSLNASVRYCGFYANTSGEPANNAGYGFRMPTNGNGAYLVSDDTIVSGIYNGMECGEHQRIGYHWSQNCLNGISVPTISHAVHASVLLLQRCKYGVQIAQTLDSQSNPIRVKFEEMQLEVPSSGNFSGGAQVVDSGNKGSGLIWYAMNKFTGASTTFTKTGAANITCTSLGNPP